jgi:hypothetical protein
MGQMAGLLAFPFFGAFIAAGYMRATPWVILGGAVIGTVLYAMVKEGIPVVWRREPVRMTLMIGASQAVIVSFFYGLGYAASSALR